MECESCKVSFKYFDNAIYSLKDFKEKSYLEKYKNSKLHYDEWVKIGQGKYTDEEEKELAELDLAGEILLQCPNCDVPFNKYDKKGSSSFDSIICPSCNARYNMIKGKYKFINIPNKDSPLWSYYNKDLTIDELYHIFGKKYEPTSGSIPNENNNKNVSIKSNLDVFECEIVEKAIGLTNDRDENRYKSVVTLYDSYLEISKSSYWRNKDRGSKEILYNKITSVDLDIGGFLKWNAVELTISGSNIISLMNVNDDLTTSFYNHLKKVIREYNLTKEQHNTQQNSNNNNNQSSNPDELLKWHELMEKGIISQEEFEAKKKELLGL